MTINDLKNEVLQWKLTKYKIINFAIGMGALLFYEFVGRPYYRPYIYAHNIYDFHIADTLGNSFGTIATIFILVALLTSNRTHGYFLIKTIMFSLVLYEIAHPVFGKPIDPWDIVATLVTGALCFFLFRYLFENQKSAGTK